MNDLPPKGTAKPGDERQFRTALSPSNYLRLEEESLSRGLTPYRLTQIVLTMYLDGRLTITDNSAASQS